MPSDHSDLYRKMLPADRRAKEFWEIEKCFEGQEKEEWRNWMELHLADLTGNGVDEKILLDVPDSEILKGDYPLGMVWHGDRRCFDPFCLRDEELSSHISVFGLTGSGKTNTVLHILQTVPHNFIVFDWKRSYRDLMSIGNVNVFTVGRKTSPLYFNPLVPPKDVDPETWIKSVIWSMQHAFFGGHGVERILEKSIPGCKNLYELSGKLNDYRARGRELDWLQSTKRAVDALCWGELGRQLNTTKLTIEDFMEHRTVFELDALTPSEAVFLTYVIVLGIYNVKQEGKDRTPHIVVLEEAHNVLPEARDITQETPLEKVLRQIRELGSFGTCMVVVDQLPHKLSHAAIANCATNICLNLKLAQDVEAAAKMLLLPQDNWRYLGRLGKGQAIVKSQHRYHNPFLVRIPLVRLTEVTEDEVRERMQSFAEIPLKERGIPAMEEKLIIGQKELALLVDVNECPFDGMQERYRRLRLNGKQGARMVRELEANGWIRSDYLRKGGVSYKVLALEDRAKDLLEERGHKVERFRDGGIEHRYWQEQWLQRMRKEHSGCEVVKEHPVGKGGTVDVAVLEKGEGKIAIEIETSSVDRTLRNVAKDLEAGFEKVIIVGKRNIVEQVEQRLSQERRVEFEAI